MNICDVFMCFGDASVTKSCQEIVNYAFRAEFERYSVDWTCQTTKRKQSGHLVSTTQVCPEWDRDPLMM